MEDGIVKVTKEDIGKAIESIAEKFHSELMSKTEEELEEYWFFKYDSEASLAWNMYSFFDMLHLYRSHVRRWEEGKNGTCCVVERVRDKYLMPKIEKFAEQIMEMK